MSSSLPWWRTGVIYQVYPRSFQDANGDGIGDLRGVADRVDYIARLGVDAVWLSPFYRSPMADFGYDVADYLQVDPIFGDQADFDHLVEALHARGLRLLVDYVPNHSSDQHAWFQDSRSSKGSPRRDWYVWRDPAPDGGPPNNWLSVFGGSAWEFDAVTGQYYLHSFLKEQPDLNWRNSDLRKAMMEVLSFWMDRGVDGFRIDVAHYLMKDPAERSNPPSTGGVPGHKSMGEYDSQIHLFNKAHEDIHTVFQAMRELVDSHPDDRERVLVGEIHEYDLPTWAAYYGKDGTGLHMPFNFALLKAPFTAEGIREHVETIESVVPKGCWPNYVLGNHDEQRLATRYGPGCERLAAMLLLTLRGTPTLYYGDEVGMIEGIIDLEHQRDPWGLRVPGMTRDGCRTPMQWESGPTAGFTTGSPWLPVSTPDDHRNVTHQESDPGSLLNLYRALLALRKSLPALSAGTYRSLNAPINCFLFERAAPGATGGTQRVAVALNFGDSQVTVDLPKPGRVKLRSDSLHNPSSPVERVAIAPKQGTIVLLD